MKKAKALRQRYEVLITAIVAILCYLLFRVSDMFLTVSMMGCLFASYIADCILKVTFTRYVIVMNEGPNGDGKKYYLIFYKEYHPHLVDNVSLFTTSYKAIMLMKELQQIEKNDCLKIERVL